jgi:hypothetical protein
VEPAAIHHQQIVPRPSDAHLAAGDEHLAAAADMVDSPDLGPIAVRTSSRPEALRRLAERALTCKSRSDAGSNFLKAAAPGGNVDLPPGAGRRPEH